MTFLKAKRKLAELANGEYYSLGYEFTHKGLGHDVVVCTVYVHQFNHHSAPTWEGAFVLLKRQMGLAPVVGVDLSECPRGNV